MLITLLLPTAGEARVLGYDVVRDAREVRKRIGYVFGGDRGLYERLSGLDNLKYFAELYGVSGRTQRMRIQEVLELVGLTGREGERVEGYSRGMRQRLHIARGILHDPQVVFLDEPTIGVDPVGARMRKMIADLITAEDRPADDALHVRGGRALIGLRHLARRDRRHRTPAELKDVSRGRVMSRGAREADRDIRAGADRRSAPGRRPDAAARRPDERRARADRADPRVLAEPSRIRGSLRWFEYEGRRQGTLDRA
jgi:predicted ABC-type transport system involved in lysophospholipase L1 biosynthesis ATPase subunit